MQRKHLHVLTNSHAADDDIAEYITGIIEDESMEEDEKREVISEFLSEATVSLDISVPNQAQKLILS